MMDKKDFFNQASAGMAPVKKASRFNNAMKKCNLAAKLTEAGIDKTAFDNSRWN